MRSIVIAMPVPPPIAWDRRDPVNGIEVRLHTSYEEMIYLHLS